MIIKRFDKKANDLADKVIAAAKAGDRAKHWKAVYELLRHQNKKARKEQDKVAKECAEARADKTYKKTKSKTMGLRFGVAMPPMTYNALVEADRLAYGRSDLYNTDKESQAEKDSTNSIVKDLERAFPQFKVS
jgi:hypothetical protein